MQRTTARRPDWRRFSRVLVSGTPAPKRKMLAGHRRKRIANARGQWAIARRPLGALEESTGTAATGPKGRGVAALASSHSVAGTGVIEHPAAGPGAGIPSPKTVAATTVKA